MTGRAIGMATCAWLAMLLLAVAPASARNLGVRGATWPVAEPDLLADIEARLSDMDNSGELARLEDEARERARGSVEQPEPVPGIVPATEYRAREFDPAIVVAQDILGPGGEVLAAAGTRVDPFE
ncbi:MAG: type-F conjugative transfer system protein TraW, partial [Gammaproteobacteria bacterium]|nr:type-F conjugative transfer system protein TraW [Gammaproteobacteria bacterium]